MSQLQEPTRYSHSPFASVYLSYAFSVPANTLTQVPFDVALANENGCFSFSPSAFFTAPQAGRYMFLVNLGLFNAANSVAYARVVRKNSADVVVQTLRPTGTAGSYPSLVALSGSAVMEANVGDKFSLEVFCDKASNFFGSNTGEWDNWQIFRLT